MEALSSVREMAELAAQEASVREQTRRAMRTIGQERWYLAHIGVRGELKTQLALKRLERYEIEPYYPRLRKMVPIPKQRLSAKQRQAKFTPFEPKLVPLFPRYMFVRFDLRRGDWRDVFEEIGIWGMQVEREADRPLPAPVTDALVMAIRNREIDGAVPGELPLRQFAYEIGEIVRITEGSFLGHEAIVKDLPENTLGNVDENVKLELTKGLFGRPHLVELPLSHIAKR